jgi:hypothetical protein
MVAAECYVSRSPPPLSREETVTVAARDRVAGRPAKRERRSTGKLPGRPAGRGSSVPAHQPGAAARSATAS